MEKEHSNSQDDDYEKDPFLKRYFEEIQKRKVETEEFKRKLRNLIEQNLQTSLFYRNGNKLIWRKDLYEKADYILSTVESSIFVAIVFFIMWIIAMFTVPYLTNEFVLVVGLIALSCAIYPSLKMLLYLLYRNRVFEWVFDKSSGKILHHRILPSFKLLKSFKLKDLIAVRGNRKHDIEHWDHSIELIFQKSKKIEFQLEKDITGETQMLAAGKKIGSFLDLPFSYRIGFTKKTYAIFGFSSFMLIVAIYITILSWAGLFVVVTVVGISIIIAIRVNRDFTLERQKESKERDDFQSSKI